MLSEVAFQMRLHEGFLKLKIPICLSWDLRYRYEVFFNTYNPGTAILADFNFQLNVVCIFTVKTWKNRDSSFHCTQLYVLVLVQLQSIYCMYILKLYNFGWDFKLINFPEEKY